MKDRILKAMEDMRDPAQTWQIASFMKCYNNTPKVLCELKKLEKEGKVYRHERSKRNSIVWCLRK